jgi:hypothetical protein
MKYFKCEFCTNCCVKRLIDSIDFEQQRTCDIDRSWADWQEITKEEFLKEIK